jgi:hypothetical protein
VLDACKTCGGSVTDILECSPLAGVIGAEIGIIVGGCVAISIIVFVFWLRRKRAKIFVSKESTTTETNASLQLPSVVSKEYAPTEINASLQLPRGHPVSASITAHHESESLRIQIRPISKPHDDMPSSSQSIRYVPAGHISPYSNTAAIPHFNGDSAVDEIHEILPGTPSRSVPRE